MLLGAISHLLILLVSCQISSTSWRIFHKLNLLLQVTGIVQIAPIVSIISRASFHHLLLQLSISPAIDDLRWLTTFSVTQKQNWVPIDGNGSWKSLIWGFLVSASVPHNKVFFFFPDTPLLMKKIVSPVSAFKGISRIESINWKSLSLK